MVWSDVRLSASLVMQVWRRSWKRIVVASAHQGTMGRELTTGCWSWMPGEDLARQRSFFPVGSIRHVCCTFPLPDCFRVPRQPEAIDDHFLQADFSLPIQLGVVRLLGRRRRTRSPSRWPSSSSRTARAVFPHAALATRVNDVGMRFEDTCAPNAAWALAIQQLLVIQIANSGSTKKYKSRYWSRMS
jgi:hypothetical protein